jgi:hypothetical protein
MWWRRPAGLGTGKACGVNLGIGSVREARADQKDAPRGKGTLRRVKTTRVVMTANSALSSIE